jgi:hypothetical protein
MNDKILPNAPLANLLFGWALNQKSAAPVAIALGVISALLIVEELVRGRQGLNLPYEDTPAFYGLAGFAAVAAALLAAHVFKLVFARLPSGDEE